MLKKPFVMLGLLLSSVVMLMNVLAQSSSTNVFEINKTLARTVNLGNALEAQNEGQLGITLTESYFEIIKQAGFTAVRVPIKWSSHAEAKAPYKIARDFWLRIDWVIQNAKKNDLTVILDLHNYDELIKDPLAHKNRWLGLWRQVADRYKNQPETVIFELCNEPNGNLEPYWNAYMKKALEIVRVTNPARAVIVGPNAWNNADQLKNLELPQDSNLIVTFHNYTPFNFTHQGAEWWTDGAKHLGTTWTATDAQKLELRTYMDQALIFSKAHNRPIFMGEFGAYKRGDLESRVRWTKFVRQEAEVRGFSWGYWEFASGFGIYDWLNDRWRKELLDALIEK